MNETVLKKAAKLFLLMATFIWGSSFVVMKNTINNLPAFYLLSIRFLVAAAILSLIFHKRWKHLKKGYLWRGGLMGVFLWLAYISQTSGLMGTTPSVNAFLTTVYCVIVPFLYWLTAKQRPNAYNIAAALMSIGGVGLVSLEGPLTNLLSIKTGDLLTLLGGFFFAAHMVAVAKFAKGRDVFLLTILQFLAAGILSLTCGLLFDRFPTHLETPTIMGIAYLSIFATAAALLFQNIGQKYTEPAAASVLLSLESVFGVLCSMLFYGERPTLQMFCGFALIFFAVICSETKFSFLKKSEEAKCPVEEHLCHKE